MPRKNEAKPLDMEEEIKKEIEKQEAVEETSSDFNVKYKQDSKVYNKQDEYGLSLEKYKEYTGFDEEEDEEYYGLTDTSDFLEAMNLKKGIRNVYCSPKKFNAAVKAVMKKDYARKKTELVTDKKTGLLKGEEKNSFVMGLEFFDKESIIERAREIRSKAFNYLIGCGNPSASNPYFVKEITEIDTDGAKTKRLAYDYKAIDSLVSTFQSDDDLYKSTIENIKTRNFRTYYLNLNYYITKDEEGKDSYRFGTGTTESAFTQVKKIVRDYNSFKEIHANRPWYYFITHPFENYYEGRYLEDIHDDIMNTARMSGIADEMEDALNAPDKLIMEDSITQCVDALKRFYGVEDEADASAEIEKDSKTESKEDDLRKNIVLDNNQIDPVVYEQDDLHPYAIDGYAMGERTAYLTKEEYERTHQEALAMENEISNEK